MIRNRAFFCQVGLALQYRQDWLTLKMSWPGSWISLRIIEQIFCLPTSFSCDPLSSDKYWSALSLPLVDHLSKPKALHLFSAHQDWGGVAVQKPVKILALPKLA